MSPDALAMTASHPEVPPEGTGTRSPASSPRGGESVGEGSRRQQCRGLAVASPCPAWGWGQEWGGRSSPGIAVVRTLPSQAVPIPGDSVPGTRGCARGCWRLYAWRGACKRARDGNGVTAPKPWRFAKPPQGLRQVVGGDEVTREVAPVQAPAVLAALHPAGALVPPVDASSWQDPA